MKKYKNQVEENEGFRHQRNEAGREQGNREEYTRGVAIAEIEPGSVAEELGLVPGDHLVAIDGERARDVLQLKKADLRENVTLTISSGTGITHYQIEKDVAESLGIGVDAELFDGVKRCTNKCPFCFVDQLPPRVKGEENLRRTLYVRDDDFRLSFLHGHYITLTNLSDADFERIIEEKLSPLCVSVHATDPETRIRMVGNPTGGNIMERLRFLIDNGIQINAQIVLCPGINDRNQLDKSIEDLMSLYPGVESMAVVPVGLTRFMPQDRGMRVLTFNEARDVLRQLRPWQKMARDKWGINFVYASDEMYLLAGEDMPGASFYDGFPQYANGVGTIRSFLDDVSKLKRRKVQTGEAPRVTLVTGSLAAPALRTLAGVLKEKNIADAYVAEIQNTYWGGNVACAGLIMGQEVLAQLKDFDCGEYVFLPPDAVDNQGRMLDDITLEMMSRKLNTTVRCDAIGPVQLANILSRN
jgi:putative radical SAM enzyme (TIGR03279 family)